MRTYTKILAVLWCGILMCCASVKVAGQVVINFTPEIYGQTVDGLVYAQLISSSPSDLAGKLTIRVRALKGGQVLTVRTPVIVIHPGSNVINRNDFGRSAFNFSKNNYGLTASRTGRFLEGEYEYCYELELTGSKGDAGPGLFENCFIHNLRPMTPLLLLDPIDGDEFCNPRPNFVWQPPVPMPQDARFRFVLTEIYEKQDVATAITYNTPVVIQGNLMGNMLQYPPNAPALKEGQKYAWQVIVYSAATILSRSEIWTFTHKCKLEINSDGPEGYRELKEVNDGSFLAASEKLRFSLQNPYSGGVLNYSIVNLAEPATFIKGLPELKLTTGLNKFEIDLDAFRAFKPKQEYLLRVVLQQNRIYTLRFIYKPE